MEKWLYLLNNLKHDSMTKKSIKDLGPEFTIFGNKGNVWTDTAHAYKRGEGNLCGTPALSHNHALSHGIEEVGCPACLEKLKAV
jgi:hypothetical protein